MITLITTKTVPPGGWVYSQLDAQRKVLKNFSSMNPFSMAYSDILDFRVGNNLPRATTNEVQEDLISATCQRLGNDPRYCFDAQKKTTSTLNGLSNAVDRALDRAKKQIAGVLVVGDYVLHGSKPIPITESQARADVCTGRLSGKPCPRHVQSWDFNAPTRQVIRIEMEKRTKDGRTLQGEDALKICSVCGCWLPLKVDVPFVTIWKHTSDAMFDQFPKDTPCWITKERKESKLIA
jgi:hypothetical protein